MLKRFFRKLAADDGDPRTEQIREWAASVTGAVRIAEAEPRSVVCVAGVVEGMRVRPREGVPVVEATIGDGTGTITAVWLGRRTIPGLTLGARLILRGRLGGTKPNLQLMNPGYEFFAPPDPH